MDKDTPHAGGGLWSTLTRMFRTLRDMVEDRAELFIVEWREERLRLMEMLFLLLAGGICALMALIMITFAIVAAFWNTHPVLVLGLMTLFYAILAAMAFGMVRARLRRWQVFAATLDQIKKDRECFKEKR